VEQVEEESQWHPSGTGSSAKWWLKQYMHVQIVMLKRFVSAFCFLGALDVFQVIALYESMYLFSL